jgi:hypothetical protein
MNRSPLRAGLLTALLLAPGALAQTSLKPVTTLKATLTLKIPAGAKTLVIAHTETELQLLELPAGATRISVSINLTPATYKDSYSVQVGKNSSMAESNLSGTYTVHPLKVSALSPALNVWTPLWQGTQKSSTSFSFTLGGKKMSGNASPDAFKTQVLFTPRLTSKIDKTLQPPRLP